MKVNARTMFVSLMSVAVIAAIVAIAQIWLAPLSWDVFLKVMATLLIVGVLASFLLAVDYDLGSSNAKAYLLGLVTLANLAAAIITAQIWLDFFPWGTFGDMLLTLGILAALIGFILVAREDFSRNKRLRDDNYID